MFNNRKSRIFFVLIPLLLLLILSLMVAVASAKPAKVKNEQLNVIGVSYGGIVTYTTGTEFASTEVGGLSGITYDANRGVYYVVSDDRSQINDARFYTVAIDLSDGTLDDGDVQFLDVTTILDENGQPFESNAVDPEGIALRKEGQLFISSEFRNPYEPFVKRFNWVGEQTANVPIPDKFMPGEDTGADGNLAFESLTFTPDGQVLWTATESALKQDGPPSTVDDPSPARMIQYNAPQRKALHEFVYIVSPIPEPPIPPDAFADNGLSDMVALDNAGTLLAMERSYAVGVGNTVKIFQVLTDDATDVSGDFTLPANYDPVEKTMVVNVGDLVQPDNLEGMTLGPTLPDGRQSLILVSDNNFNPSQITQFILLTLDIEPVPLD